MRSEQGSRVPGKWPLGCSAAVMALLGGTPASAHEVGDRPVPETADEEGARSIIVTAPRGSAIADVPPIAEFDENAIAAMGAATMDDVVRTIRGAAQGADGSPPIFLLNAQRVASYQEIGSLPPEALEKIEVLPEQAALRFGFPPTRRVLNFITKRRFRQIEVKASAGTLTRGGSSTLKANAGLTRLQRTLSMTLNANGRLGKPPPPPPPGSSGVQQVPSYYGGIGPTLKLLDRLQLRPGAPEFDLLDGDTITGA